MHTPHAHPVLQFHISVAAICRETRQNRFPPRPGRHVLACVVPVSMLTTQQLGHLRIFVERIMSGLSVRGRLEVAQASFPCTRNHCSTVLGSTTEAPEGTQTLVERSMSTPSSMAKVSADPKLVTRANVRYVACEQGDCRRANCRGTLEKLGPSSWLR